MRRAVSAPPSGDHTVPHEKPAHLATSAPTSPTVGFTSLTVVAMLKMATKDSPTDKPLPDLHSLSSSVSPLNVENDKDLLGKERLDAMITEKNPTTRYSPKGPLFVAAARRSTTPTEINKSKSAQSNKRKRVTQVGEETDEVEEKAMPAPRADKRIRTVIMDDKDAIALETKRAKRRPGRKSGSTPPRKTSLCANKKLAKTMKDFNTEQQQRPQPAKASQVGPIMQKVGALPRVANDLFVQYQRRPQPVNERKVEARTSTVKIDGKTMTYIKPKNALTFSDGEGGFKQIKTVLKGGPALYPNITINETEDGEHWEIVIVKMTEAEKTALSVGYREKEKLEQKLKRAKERQEDKDAKNLLCYGTTKPKAGRRNRHNASPDSVGTSTSRRGTTDSRSVKSVDNKAKAAGVSKSGSSRRSGRGVAMKVTSKGK